MALPAPKYQPTKPRRPPPPEDEKRQAKDEARRLLARGRQGRPDLAQTQRNIAEANIQRAAQATGYRPGVLGELLPLPPPIPGGLPREEGKRRAAEMERALAEWAKARAAAQPRGISPEELRAGREIGPVGGIAQGIPKGLAAKALMPPPQLEFLAPFSRERRAGWAEALAPRTTAEAYGQMVGGFGPGMFAFGMEPLTPQELAHPLTAAAFAFPPGMVITKGLPAMRAGLGEPSVLESLRGVRRAVGGLAEVGERQLAEARAVPGGLEAGFARLPKRESAIPKWEVEVAMDIQLPGRVKPERGSRLFQVNARTQAQAIKAVKDAGHTGEITGIRRADIATKQLGVPLTPKAPPPAPAAAKEPWRMTPMEYLETIKEQRATKVLSLQDDETYRNLIKLDERGLPIGHRKVVERALSEGKPVPAEVLADYPELAGLVKAPAASARAAEAAPAVAPRPAAPKAEAARETSYQNFLDSMQRRNAMDEAGQAILDDLALAGKSPMAVSEEFWTNTYPKLPTIVQRRFQRYLKRLTGGPIEGQSWESLARELDLPGLPEGAETLEGIERGYVALMEEGNRRFVLAGIAPAAPPKVGAAPPAEVVAPTRPERAEVGRAAEAAPVAEAVTPPPPTKPPVVKGPPPQGPVSQKPPASPPSVPAPPSGSGQGIQAAIQAAQGSVEMTRPGLITRILDYIPGVRQVMREVHPRLKMSDEILTGWVAEGGAEATVSNSLQVERFTALKQLEASFGKPQVLAGEAKATPRFTGTVEQARYPHTNTLRDVLEYPELYDLTPAQRALIDGIGGLRDTTFGGLRSSYNLKVGQFQRRPGSIFFANYDVSEPALEAYGSAERAGMIGRGKERFYEGARQRWEHTKTFNPDTNVYRLFESMDESAAKMAGRQTFIEAVGGKTKLQAMEELHPKLATALTAVKNRVNKIKGYQSSLRQQTQDVIDDFLASGMEDADLAALQAELSQGLKPGRFVAKAQAGKQMADLRKEWVEARKDLASLQTAWRVADLRPYQRIQEAGNLLFKAEDAKELSRLLKTSSNRLLRFVDNLRATAFGGDFSPVSIQGLTAWFTDPVGVSRAVAGATAKGVLPSFTEEGLVAFARANPERISRFTQATGIRFLGGVTPEFATGFPGKIPKVGKFWTEFNESLYRPLMRHMESIFNASYEGALKRGLTEVQAMAVGADDASKIIPRINYRLLGQSQAEAARYRAVLTSVSFLTRPTALVADATKGIVKMGLLRPLSQNEKFAVRRVLTLMATIESLAVASHVAYARSKGQDMKEAALDSLNPESGFFMSLVLPNGWKVGMGGPYRSLFKAIAPSRIEGVPVPIPFAGVSRWAMGKMGPGARVAYDEIRDKDFYGRQIRTGNFPVNILQGLAYAFEGSLPLTLGEAARGVRTGELLGDIGRETLGQFGGVNISPVVTISEFRRKWRGDIQPYQDIPSTMKTVFASPEEGKAYKKKYPQNRQDYREDNPEVDARLFILGEVSSLKSDKAFNAVVRLMKENNLGIKDIKKLEPDELETEAKKKLREKLQKALESRAPISSELDAILEKIRRIEAEGLRPAGAAR